MTQNDEVTGEFQHISKAVQITVANFAITMATGDWEKLLGDFPAHGKVYYSPSCRQLVSQHPASNTVAVAQLDDRFHIVDLTITYAEKNREPEDGYPRTWHGDVLSLYADMVSRRTRDK